MKWLASGLLMAVVTVVIALGVYGAQAEGGAPPTTNVQVINGHNPGEAIISWDTVPQATHYRIGYVNMVRDYPIAKSSATGEWLEAFLYADVNARNFSVVNGRVNYTIRGLCQNTRHAVTVLTSSDVTNTIEQFGGQYYWPQDPRWQFITTADHGDRCPGVSTTPPSSTAPTAGDYDADNDGLIEVSNLAQLDAMRHDLDGDGSATHSDYAAAYTNALAGMGCPAAGCTGYELTANLDFDTNGSGHADAGDAYWNGNWGWTPIGDPDEAFRWNATFDGNGHTISNLYISWGDTDHVGLFRATGPASVIRNVGLVSIDVSGQNDTGSLVGNNDGDIANAYATGRVIGDGYYVGGLVGSNDGTISNSFATANVTGKGYHVGGLVGSSGGGLTRISSKSLGSEDRDTTITASYSTGDVTGDFDYVGGLVGSVGNAANITASYATGNVSGKNHVGGLAGKSSETAITAGYASGNVSGRYTTRTNRGQRRVTVDGESVGGLIGSGSGTTVVASYANGTVQGAQMVGGLVGNVSGGTIRDSYAAGSTSFPYTTHWQGPNGSGGGLIGGGEDTTVVDSYWDSQATGLSHSRGGIGKTTRELQSPTASTGIYANWNPNWWDFGTVRQYPALKYGGLDPASQRR